MRWKIKKNRFFRRSKWIWLTVLLVGIFSLPWTGVPILKILGNFLIQDTFRGKADYAVVLNGRFPDRVMEAAALFKEGRVEKILIPFERQNDGYHRIKAMGIRMPSTQDRMVHTLGQLRVPKEKVVRLFGAVNSTKAEAGEVKKWLMHKRIPKPSRILVLTSPTHTRRARMIFARTLGDLAQVMVKPSRYDTFAKRRWWVERHRIKEVILEYEKLFFSVLTGK